MSNTRRSSQVVRQTYSDLSATILDGETESDGIQLGGTSLVALDIPAGFDGTTMTFKVSSDGTTYKDYKRLVDGMPVSALCSADASFAADYYDFAAYEWIKLVAGTAQTGNVEITLKTRSL